MYMYLYIYIGYIDRASIDIDIELHVISYCNTCALYDNTTHYREQTVYNTKRTRGACVRVYARVLVPPNLYIHIHTRNTTHI